MSKKMRLATFIFTFSLLIIVIIYVATKFFTNDKYYAPIAKIEEKTFLSTNNEFIEVIISPKVLSSCESQEQSELQYTNENEIIETLEDEKQLTTTSRYSSELKSSKPEITQINQISDKEFQSYDNDDSEEDTKIESSTIEDTKITSNTDSMGTIYIPKTGINLPILKSVTVSGMETAVCCLYSTGALNIHGTTLIVGHNYCNGKLFSNNKNLQIGDSIYVTTTDGKQVQYTIYEKFITDEFREILNGNKELQFKQ